MDADNNSYLWNAFPSTSGDTAHTHYLSHQDPMIASLENAAPMWTSSLCQLPVKCGNKYKAGSIAWLNQETMLVSGYKFCQYQALGQYYRTLPAVGISRKHTVRNSGMCTKFRLSPDKQFVATTATDRHGMAIYETDSLKPAFFGTISNNDAFSDFAWMNNEKLATLSKKGNLQVWDVNKANIDRTSAHNMSIMAPHVTFLPEHLRLQPFYNGHFTDCDPLPSLLLHDYVLGFIYAFNKKMQLFMLDADALEMFFASPILTSGKTLSVTLLAEKRLMVIGSTIGLVGIDPRAPWIACLYNEEVPSYSLSAQNNMLTVGTKNSVMFFDTRMNRYLNVGQTGLKAMFQIPAPYHNNTRIDNYVMSHDWDPSMEKLAVSVQTQPSDNMYPSCFSAIWCQPFPN